MQLSENIYEVERVGATVFTFDYDPQTNKRLADLYAKATSAQWRSQDLPWDKDVDPEFVVNEILAAQSLAGQTINPAGTPLELWGPAQFQQFGLESQRWTLSQFLHGEQGALVTTAKLVECVPDVSAKFFASTQVVDEARHVEVFSRYLQEKWGGFYDITSPLQVLLKDILSDSRWDMTYLGMQVMVEGLALAAFSLMRQVTTEPLLGQLLRYVMADEARHVAFGTLSLTGVYSQLSDREIQERAEFAWEAALAMRDRFTQKEVFERLGVDFTDVKEAVEASPSRAVFQGLLFSRIVPNCSKLGLLDRNDAWLRKRFDSIGVLGFESMTFDDELVV